MKLIQSLQLLSEAQLSAAEILKPHGGTGEPRTEILAKMIKGKKDIELKDGSKVVIDPVKSKNALQVLASGDEEQIKAMFGARGAAGKVFVTTSGEQLALSAFKKTPNFGGGSAGKGAGADQTATQEAAQCVALAIATSGNKKSLKPEDLTPAKMKTAAKRYSITTPLEKVAALMEDPAWNQSTVVATNAILTEYPNVKGMVFHHQDEWVKQLEKTFNSVNRGEGKYFSNINKWNPSDIWAVKPGLKPPMGSEANTLIELNAWLQKNFEERNVIGFSLKKVGKTATAKRVNYHGDVDELLDITIHDLLVSKKNELFKSKDSYIVFEGESILPSDIVIKEDEVQFRSFGGDDPIQGEIKGKTAAHGKIGHGAINKILSRVKLRNVTSRNDIYAMRNMDAKDKAEKYAPVVSAIINNAKMINPQVAKAAEASLRKIANEIEHNVLISKFQAVELLAIIKKASHEAKETFIQELIGMASSRTQLSSVFVKVA